MLKEYVREQLIKHVDRKYREFHIKLIPNISHDNTLGVRIPQLRAIAKQLIKDDLWKEYLELTPEYLEEIMIQGILIGHIKVSLDERMLYMTNFIPLINNWAVCDIFCCTLKLKSAEKEVFWEYLQSYFRSSKPYDIRVGVVMGLANFPESIYAEKAFLLFDQITNEDYYVKMAVAWAISVYFIKNREITIQYLSNNSLDKFTQNKAIQKIRESLRVSLDDKEFVNTFKRK